MRSNLCFRALSASGLVALALVVTSACSSSAGTSSATAETPANAAASDAPVAGTAAPVSTAWQVALQTTTPASINLAGFLSPTYGIAVGTAGLVDYTSDGGKTWTKAQNDSLCRFGLDIVDQNVAWHCGNGGVGLSTDGGKTWQVAGSLATPEPDQCRSLSFLDAKTGWAATLDQLNATTDGGATWKPLTLPTGLTGNITAASLRTPNDGYLLDTAGTIWITADGGQSWSKVSLALPSGQTVATGDAPLAAVHFFDASRAVVVAKLTTGNGPAFVAMHSADGGKTWQSETLPGDPRFVNSFYLGRDGTTLTVSASGQLTVYQYHS